MQIPKIRTVTKAKRAKLADVAAAVGVHYSTVSRVLNPGSKGRISTDVAAKVRLAAEELGYQTNWIASSMRTNSTRSIGLIVHDMSDPVYPPILSGIETVLAPEGFAVLIGNTGYDIELEIETLNRMASRLVEGIFLATTRLEDPSVARCQELSIPLVSVLRHTEAADTPHVINDCFGGMQALTGMVLDRGHKDIAVILAPQNLSTARERWRGIEETLQKNGVELPKARIAHVARMSIEDGETAAQGLLTATEQPPHAIICVNDLVAVGAIRACRKAGLSIPDDISITGFNDIPLVDMIDPPLTTVRMRLDEIGKTAGKVMLAQLGITNSMPQNIRIDSDIMLRNSLGEP